VSAAAAPLRVHILIDSLTWGGAEMLLGDLAASASSAGIELTVGYLNEIDDSPAAARLRRHGIEPQLVPVRRMLDQGALRRLRRQLVQARPQIVHTHLTLADAIGTIAARSLGLPAVSTIHLIAGQPTGRPSDGDRRTVARTRLVAFARRHAAVRVIAVSDAARDAYLATGWDTPERVLTVHNGIARTAARAADGARVRAELGIAPDALLVSIVTVLRPGKGHDVAIAAVRRLLARFPALRLLVLGDGPSREDVRRLAAPLGSAAVLAGHRDDVMAVLAATDVLLHPTNMDAFPTALLEAAAASVPVIASRVGGIPEIVADGATGVLVEAPVSADGLASALGDLLADGDKRARLAQNARARFDAEFTAARWAQRLRELYQAILSR
jgi:glycosyltransferase involved in cell wall biosynthesis